MSKSITNDVSQCHNAPVKLVGGRGDFRDSDRAVTMHYECTECNEACDLASPNSVVDNSSQICGVCGHRFLIREAQEHLKTHVSSSLKPKSEPLDDTLDELVRDACSVTPVSKGEYRARLLAWRDATSVTPVRESK